MPGVIDYSRTYHFALPSTALYAAALVALFRSDGLRSWRWALVWGVLLGMTVLSRTMMLALAPVLAAALLLVVTPGARLARFGRLALGIAALAATAGSWYGANLSITLRYLLDFGFGTHSVYYGQTVGIFSVGHWTGKALEAMQVLLYAPAAVLLLILLFVGALLSISRLWHSRRTRSMLQQARARNLVLLGLVSMGA